MSNVAEFVTYKVLLGDQESHPAALPTVFTAEELGGMRFTPIKYIVPGLIPEGCTILAGRPKLGKSWLVLDVALAVARGSYCLGNTLCLQGDVLYLALEDNHRRLQSRLKKVSPPQCSDPWPARLKLATSWPRAEEGGLEQIREWARSMPDPRLVVIDVLAQFRSAKEVRDTYYDADYQAVKALQQLAGDLHLAVIVVHHVRKGGSEIDPFEQVSGTMGLTGAADTTIILDRNGQGCSLYARGRDIAEYEKAITFAHETCRWTVQGDAAEIYRSDERGGILAALMEATEPMTVQDIVDATGMRNGNCRQLLSKMCRAQEVNKIKRGHYVHPSRTDLIPT